MICDWCGKPADHLRAWHIKMAPGKWKIAGYYCNICYDIFRRMDAEVRPMIRQELAR